MFLLVIRSRTRITLREESLHFIFFSPSYVFFLCYHNVIVIVEQKVAGNFSTSICAHENECLENINNHNNNAYYIRN